MTKKKSNKLVSLLIFLFLYLAAYCTNSDREERTVDTITDSTIENVCKQISETICNNAIKCNCDKVYIFPDNCLNNLMQKCKDNLKNLPLNQPSGSILLSQNRLTSCIELINTYTKNCIFPPKHLYLAVCSVFISDAKAGEKCSNLLCEEGTAICSESEVCTYLPRKDEKCYKGLCNTNFVCNTNNICIEPCKKGESCQSDSECDYGLICIENICSEVEINSFYKTCNSDSECKYGAKCLSAEQKSCTRPKDAGETCQYTDECRSGLFCDDTEKRCIFLPGTGEKCAGGTMCDNNSGCDTTDGVCKELPKINEPCLSNQYGQVLCQGGLLCIDGICLNPPSENQRCGRDRDGLYKCGDGLGCFFMDNGENICKKKVNSGEICTNDSNCQDSDFCDYSKNICSPKFKKGSLCRFGNECEDGLVCDFRSKYSEPACIEPPTEGEECFINCSDNLICNISPGSKKCIPPVCTTIISE
ncbi:MAG: hypothetical protein N3B13_10605 [Deltaproteobacteria bacterium]|nr:hypothetical protein [Deltaproteobacteria bacterium]